MVHFYTHLMDHELELFSKLIENVHEEIKVFLNSNTETQLIAKYVVYLKLELAMINNRFELNMRCLELNHQEKSQIDRFILTINTSIEKIITNLNYVQNKMETMRNLYDLTLDLHRFDLI